MYPSIGIDVWKTLRGALMPSVFERVEAGAPHWPVISGAVEPEEVRAQALTPGTFALLGARPLAGRLSGDLSLPG